MNTPGDDIIYRFTFSKVNGTSTFFNVRLNAEPEDHLRHGA